MNRRHARAATASAGALVLAMLAACTTTNSASADKTGGDTAVLRLATQDGSADENAQYYGPAAFVQALRTVSGGRLKVQLTAHYGNGAADAESNLVKAIAAGKIDGGWPATRAFASAGIDGLAAVEAPMTITSYAAEKALVTDPVARQLLSSLHGSGVVGLGLAAGSLRRPFSTKQALVSPAAWAGTTFRVFNSPTQRDAVTAWGGAPKNFGIDYIDEVHAGRLAGAELDVAGYAKGGVVTDVPYVAANVVLWPKVFVLSLSQHRFDTLSTQQRSWVRKAAAVAVKASVAGTYNDDSIVTQLCGQGLRVGTASADQLRGLRDLVAPVVASLGTGPDSPVLAAIRRIAAAHPQPDVLPIPAGCAVGDARPPSRGTVPTSVSALPDGIYRTQLTRANVLAAGVSIDDGNPPGTWTLKIAKGTYQLSCRPIANPGEDCGGTDTDQPLDVGDLRGSGKTVYFVYNGRRLARLTGCQMPESNVAAGHCFAGGTYRMDWSFANGSLRFSNYVAPGTNQQYLVKAWTKIG
jgi:TRAP-type C4-dicarboxylate transport system substrate-binding protein